MKIKDLKSEKTCEACPEQYDVFYQDKQVGYIRLRWGEIRVDFPDCGGETIYKHSFEDSLKGCFETDEEAKLYLSKCKKAIIKKLNENIKRN